MVAVSIFMTGCHKKSLGGENTMGTLFAFVKTGFKQRIIYRTSTLWKLVASALVLFLQIKLWQVLLSSSAIQDGRSLTDMVAYLVINALLASLTRCNAADTLASLIGDGSISCSLTRPISLKKQILCEQIGANLHAMLFTVLLPAALALALYGMTLPDVWHGVVFVVSAMLGAVILFEIQYIIGMVAFYLTTVWFASFYISGFMKLFGATVIPLWYYPDWLANLCYCLPFRYITYEPILIFLQEASNPLQTIGIQLLWIGALLLLEQFVWRRAERRLVVQGG